MSVYYNEIDTFCCEWLRHLIKRGVLSDGEIDNRSIEDVRPDDLRGFTQCHFFAGIGGWAYALQIAAWPADKPVWTGSCPCQPFSAAGKRTGLDDKRHLWPSFFWLINQCCPDTVLGEQVASKDALAWWDIVHTDLEGAGYACGICDTCAAGFGALHIRQRLYWVTAAVGGLEYPKDNGRQQESSIGRSVASEYEQGRSWNGTCVSGEITCGMVYSNGSGWNGKIFPQAFETDGQADQLTTDSGVGVAGAMPTNGFWANPDWLWCRDKKWRPIKSGVVPLVNGLPKGMVRGRDCRAIRQRLQGYGNAVVIPQAVEFIKAVLDV